ncbi:MAG: hypothetical protein C0596_12675 [Marinilabiliales bacterium]|nr:MAG: hypothetical protein C0596_12675 [Marinilabiliales bacterium]
MLKKWIKAFRLEEVLLMSGFFVIGGIFAIESFDYENILKLILLSIMSFFIVMSVYAFNAAAGKDQDKNNIRLQNLWDLKRSTFQLFSVVFFVISIFTSLYLKPISAILSLVIIIIWIFYSHPRYGLKQKAVWGTLTHFIGQILHFNLAFLIFSSISVESVLISMFFAIAFSSGHLLHEIIDYDADKRAVLKTSAISFGCKKTLAVLIGLLIINLLLLNILSIFDYINKVAFLFFLPASFFHLILLVHYYYSKKNSPIIIRNSYRVLYFISGVSLLVFLIFDYLK